MDGEENVGTEVFDAAVANFEKEREVERERSVKIDAENEKSFRLGVNGVFERRRELNAQLSERTSAIADQYAQESEEIPENLAADFQDERLAIAGEQTWSLNAPFWMQISGLYPNAHRTMSPNERAGRIRVLLRRVERMIRFDLKRRGSETATALQIENCKMKISNLNGNGNGDGDGDDDERSYINETVLWTPVRSVCVVLEIAPRFLSGLCREITGMAIQEIVDCIKAEKLRAEFRKRLKDFVLGWFAVAENWQRSVGKKRAEISDWIYAALKSSRRTRWHRTEWAFELGFSSYQRIFRAVLLCEGLTPHNLEMEVIEELVPEDEGARCVGGQERSKGGMRGAEDGGWAQDTNKEGNRGNQTADC